MSKQQQNLFWDYSLALYGQPGVAPACIILQDESGVDVNVMLFCLWLASQNRLLSASDVKEVDGCVGSWRSQIVVPLRAVRRAMKDFPAPFDGLEAQAMRNKVKAVELESERLQQQALYDLKAVAAWGVTASSVTDAARKNLAAYAQTLGTRFDAAAESAMVKGFQALMGAQETDK